MNELVSIVIPVYNAEKSIVKTLESLINQTYDNLEIIVVNDGSLDNSLKILKEKAKSDKRIKVIDKKNEGVSETRNRGIKEAKGTYLMFVDADDELEENAVESCVKEMKNCDLVRFLANEVNMDGTAKIYHCIYNDYSKNVIPAKDVFKHLISGLSSGHCWVYLYKTEIIKKNNISFDKDIFYGEDFMFVLNYLKNANKMNLIKKPFYRYHVGESTITHGFDSKVRNMKTLPTLKKKVVKIIGDDKQYIDMYNNSLLKLLVFYYSTFAAGLSRKEFKKLILDLNKTEMPIFDSINKEKIGKGSKIFLYLNQKSHINLLYMYMWVFNKLKW